MKDRIKILILVVIVLVIIFLGYFLVNKFILNKKDNTQEEKKTVNVIKENYDLGDEIIFPKLENVMFKNEDDKRDFSKWRVLSQDRNYVTLYSVVDWGEINIKTYYNELMQHRKIMEQYKLFSGYDEDFRLLSKNELSLFSCNTYNMTCLDTPDWIGTSLTSMTSSNGKMIVFNDGKMAADNTSESYLYHPVIRISKSKIE